jgi:ArsR family transcriptional regulator
VCEFVDAIGVQFATISQHLSILRQAGIVESDKRGQSVFYRLRCPCILDVVTCMQNRK